MCLKRKAIAQLQEGLPCGNEELVFRILHFVTGSEIWIQFSLSNTPGPSKILAGCIWRASGSKLQLPLCVSVLLYSQK